LKKISQLNVSDRMKLKIINKEINGFRREYIKKLKIEDPRSYLILRQSQRKDLKRFRKMNPGYQKNWRKRKSGKGKE